MTHDTSPFVMVEREKLKPFIDALDGCIDDSARDSSDIWESPAAMSITVGNLRDLKNALASAPVQVVAWHDGAPGKPWSREWFIAETTYGDRVVLKALPEEYSYDFKTADETYIKAEKIKRWSQFPDSEYRAPAQPVAVREALAARIREYCTKQSTNSVAISSDGIERIYYPGLRLDELVEAALTVLPVAGDQKESTAESGHQTERDAQCTKSAGGEA